MESSLREEEEAVEAEVDHAGSAETVEVEPVVAVELSPAVRSAAAGPAAVP